MGWLYVVVSTASLVIFISLIPPIDVAISKVDVGLAGGGSAERPMLMVVINRSSRISLFFIVLVLSGLKPWCKVGCVLCPRAQVNDSKRKALMSIESDREME